MVSVCLRLSKSMISVHVLTLAFPQAFNKTQKGVAGGYKGNSKAGGGKFGAKGGGGKFKGKGGK